MTLSEYIETRKERIIERWKSCVIERLSIKLEHSELLNDLPHFIDDVIAALREDDGAWPAIDNAQNHGRQRMRSGTDMGSLVEEMSLIVEVIVEQTLDDDRGLTCDEMIRLSRVIGRGTAASANAYSAVRDQELARQAQRHFSFIAHELRTPLQTVQLVTHALDSLLADEHTKYLKRLDRAVSQAIGLVDNSIVEIRLSGPPELQPQPLRARDVIEAVCSELQEHIDDKNVQVVVESDDVELEADEKLLLSALTNLVKNALKFTRVGGRVVIRGCERADRAIFEVEDECGGMPEDLPGRLFQPFVQANTDKSGHGLGLMIVKQAAEAHGGSVHVNNHPGSGCAFVLKLPLRSSLDPRDHGETP